MIDEEWDFERFTLEAIKIRSHWASLPPEQKSFGYLLELVSDFPSRQQAAALALLQAGYDAQALEMHRLNLDYAEREAKMNNERINTERAWRREGRAFWVGLCLLILALACDVLLSPEKVAAASMYLRILAAAGVGMMIAFLPGLFSLDTNIKVQKSKVAIRATGGFAALVLIYLFDPGWISSLLNWHKH
jgi:hypothetical protein